MTRDDIIRMAREAGIYHAYDSEGQWDGLTDEQIAESHPGLTYSENRIVEILGHFAELVAEAEREKPYQFEANHFSNDRLKVDPVTRAVSIGTPPKMILDGSAPLVVMPPQAVAKREWIELTDEEMNEALQYWSDPARSSYGGAIAANGEYVDMVETWCYIEAKLKEKNT